MPRLVVTAGHWSLVSLAALFQFRYKAALRVFHSYLLGTSRAPSADTNTISVWQDKTMYQRVIFCSQFIHPKAAADEIFEDQC